MATPTRVRHRTEGAGPVEGAFTIIPIVFHSLEKTLSGTNINADSKITFPAGAQFKLTSINCAAQGVTSDPQVSIGTSAGGTQIVAAVNITTTLGALTLKSTTLSGDFYIRIANDTGDTIRSVTLSLCGYWKQLPSAAAIYTRNSLHF